MNTEDPNDWFASLSSTRPEFPNNVDELLHTEFPYKVDELLQPNSQPTLSGDRHTDLSALLLPEDQRPRKQEPEILSRTDGSHVFYKGKFNLLYGDPESAKTWIAKAAIAQVLRNGGKASFIDLDHNGAIEIGADIVLLGVPATVVADPTSFRVYEPEDGNSVHLAVADISEWSPELVILDSLGELMPILGLKSNDNDEVTRALRAVLFPLTGCGASVVGIDHLPKGQAGIARNTDYAIGGVAKKRAANGLMLLVEKKDDFAPGAIGRASLTINKDRIGSVRKISQGKMLGTFVLDSTREGISYAQIDPPIDFRAADGVRLPVGVMQRVSVWASATRAAFSKTTAEKEVEGKGSDIRNAINELVKYGYLASDMSGTYERFTFIKKFTIEEAKLITQPTSVPSFMDTDL